MKQLWLTLILLLASLVSAPVGSMEQTPAESIGRSAHMHSVPVARPSGDLELVERLGEPDPPKISWLPQSFPPFLSAGAAAELHIGPGGHLEPAPCSSYDYTPLCERLPYDATAPPSAR